MKKGEFLFELRKKLHGLPKNDVESKIEFYSEMIDDLIEDGMNEEEAVAKIGSTDEIVDTILVDTPLSKIVKEKVKPKKKVTAVEILIIILGFPLWFPLLLTALILCFVGYILLWVLAVVVYSVFIAVTLSVLGGIGIGIYYLIVNNQFYGGIIISAAIVCAGLSILLFYGCKYTTKGIIKLSKGLLLGFKRMLVGKGGKDE